jgi:hypothetical protein
LLFFQFLNPLFKCKIAILEKHRGIASHTNVGKLHSRVRRTLSSCLLCFLMESGLCIPTASLLLSLDSAREELREPYISGASRLILFAPTPAALFTPLRLLSTLCVKQHQRPLQLQLLTSNFHSSSLSKDSFEFRKRKPNTHNVYVFMYVRTYVFIDVCMCVCMYA